MGSNILKALEKMFLSSIFLISYIFHYKLDYQHNHLSEKVEGNELKNYSNVLFGPSHICFNESSKLREFHETFACNPVISILPQYKKVKFNLITQVVINIIH